MREKKKLQTLRTNPPAPYETRMVPGTVLWRWGIHEWRKISPTPERLIWISLQENYNLTTITLIFMQDCNSKYTATAPLVKRQRVKVLEWLSQSLDLNPI